MKRKQLIDSANSLYTFSPEIANEYAHKRELLVNQINSKMLARPDIGFLVGEKNLTIMQDNHANHAHFMESMLKTFNPEILVDTILWAFRTYRSRGFHPSYWSAQFNTLCEVFNEKLSPESKEEIEVIYSWMIVNIPAFTSLSDQDLLKVTIEKS